MPLELYEDYKRSKTLVQENETFMDNTYATKMMNNEYQNLIKTISNRSYKPFLIYKNMKFAPTKSILKEKVVEKSAKEVDFTTNEDHDINNAVISALTLEEASDEDFEEASEEEITHDQQTKCVDENTKEEDEKAQISAITVTNPKSLLPYVNLKIGESVKNSIFVSALVDSGASHSLISYQVYLRLKSIYNVEEEKIQDSRTAMKAANKSSISLTHKVNLPIIFTDYNGGTHHFTWPFYVSAEIMDSAYLGEDWQRSPIFQCREKDGLVILDNGHSFTIPLESRKNSQSVPLLPLNSYILPARSSQFILTRPAFPHNVGTSVASIALEEDEENDDNDYEIIDLSQTRNEHDNYITCIRNNSDFQMVLDTNIPISKLVPLEEILIPIVKKETGKISKLILPCQDHSPILDHKNYISCQNMCKDFIDTHKTTHNSRFPMDVNDQFELELNKLEIEAFKRLEEKLFKDNDLTEEEKAAKFKELEENGYIEKSITETVEDLPVTTEYELGSDAEVFTPEQQVKKVKINHLKPEQQEKVKVVLDNYKDILALSLWDCPETNLHVADIVLKKDALDGCRICKAISIPLQLREEVNKSLKELLKQGIIRLCPEPSPYLLNILATRRKSGTYIPSYTKILTSNR